MACYIVPTVAALIHLFMRKKIPNFQVSQHRWLSNLLFGGAIFGLVDHAWNRELLLFSLPDLALGFTITAAILIAWKVMVFRASVTDKALG